MNSTPSILNQRRSGILLHPTSLPSPHGIGDFGTGARLFIDYLAEANQSYWQILPLNPPGFGNSPYAATSAFAGNTLLIDAQGMIERLPQGLRLDCRQLFDDPPDFPSDRVDYDLVCRWKLPLLQKLASRFLRSAEARRIDEFRSFCRRQNWWLDDYALFHCIKSHFDKVCLEVGIKDSSWNISWDADIASREASAVQKWKTRFQHEIEIEKVLQFFFFEQWSALKKYALERGVFVIGDIPIFVAMDSADVWVDPRMFQLDNEMQPLAVAGVPPDYFSSTGQRWGNPLYRWEAMQQNQFDWWLRRFSALNELVDIIRLDHFRGFEAYWSIPADQKTAEQGTWVKAPGESLFRTVLTESQSTNRNGLAIIAEDLGSITSEVEALRDQFGFPGMRILQFAFDPDEDRGNHFLPENYEANTVVYTGTHDNDTICGWYLHQTSENRTRLKRLLPDSESPLEIAWSFIQMAMHSVANTAIIPMQDVLGLGSEARFNFPSTVEGNWEWRLPKDWTTSDDSARRLAELTLETGRWPES